MEPIQFVVYGDPKGQPRPKAFSRGGHASVYDPKTAEGWKSQIAMAVKEKNANGLMIEGPVRLIIRAYFSRPKSHYRTGKNSHLLRNDAPHFHTNKPDFDNLEKAVADALTHLGLWKDDSQVAQNCTEKIYTNDAPPGAIIDIMEARIE